MRHLRRFEELDVAGTYLDKTHLRRSDTYSNSGQKKVASEFLKAKGKVFKDEPTTASDRVLDFEPAGESGEKRSYKVVFPKNFMGMDEPGGEKVRDLLVDKVFIVCEGRFNRIHFAEFAMDKKIRTSDGVPEEFRGTGLGYLVYENFIKFLGFASSNSSDASDEAKAVWSKIAGDPDFFGILVRVADDLELPLVFHKSCKDVESTALGFVADLVDGYTLDVRVDDALMRLPGVADMKRRFDELFAGASSTGKFRDEVCLPAESPEAYTKYFPNIRPKRVRPTRRSS